MKQWSCVSDIKNVLILEKYSAVYLHFFFQGSRDNMSIIIIAFPGAPKVDPDAVRKEDELNKLIKQKVTGNFSYFFLILFKFCYIVLYIYNF